MECVGSGSPTVVLEAGFGADTLSWRDVQPEVGRGTRTCAYDRAGTGNSVAPPGVRDARDEIADLRRLLAPARVAPPSVPVAHSYGGVLRACSRTWTRLRRRASRSPTRSAAADADAAALPGRGRGPPWSVGG